MKFYICESGEVRTKAEEHRANHIRLKLAMFDIAKQYGSDTIMADYRMMLLRGIKMPGHAPEGWSTPKWLKGCSRPKPIKANEEIRKHFTPDGCYCITPHPDLALFFKWLAVPHWYAYTLKDGGTGSSSISCGFGGPELGWFSEDGPIILTLPDMAAIKAEALASGKTLTDNSLDWAPPEGLRETCSEEWEHLEAEHKWKIKKAAK